MLVTAQNAMNNNRKDKEVVLVTGTFSSKTRKKKKKSKKGSIPQQSVGVTKKKGKAKVAADKGTCFHCSKDGHWKRNCSQYLASLKANKGKKPSEGTATSGGCWTATKAEKVAVIADVLDATVREGTRLFATGCKRKTGHGSSRNE
ncbi:hypothetical protein CRG98_039598 [Punica granatum]|uniref:CCHC-type domain-containing protein n=1 Tax=Punica granatum TaxID=22663 RepID=A0A2I0I7R0_PUNGR|nr:hypothetical protein CRG98_039598 [Punica granatum]